MMEIEKELQKHFGFNSFRTGQREVISKILAQQSAAAIFPTGAGKSICYQLPAMILPYMTLVVSPLIALMKDQVDFLLRHHVPAARLDSSLSQEDYDSILRRAKNGDLKILMISVERFKNERFRSHLQKMKISLLVVDEAHCISEWGHNFRPEYLKLPFYKKEFGIRQVLLLTATATEQVIDDMCVKFEVPRKNVNVTGFYRSNLFLQVTPTKESQKQAHLLQRIRESPKDPTIVYVTLQKTAENVSNFLVSNGIVSLPYHAGMTTEERERIQNEYFSGGIDCIVATIAFGMGIDKKDIRRVIHYDLPKSIENYSQEIGRSGRDGKPSFCEVLCNRDNISVLENFIYGDTPEIQAIKHLLHTLQHHRGSVWETKLIPLSYDLNIKMLPLKTLLVYLDMEKIILPMYSRFEEYVFKYRADPLQIIDKFDGERKDFVREILNHAHTKKVWTDVDFQGILKSYPKADRQRIIAALEYFSEKGWIALQTKRVIEAFQILTREFDIDTIGEKIYRLFETKEKREIRKIHDMVAFFEQDSCISGELARYFGEDIKMANCGHCSFCKIGRAIIPHKGELQPLDSLRFGEMLDDFLNIADDCCSVSNAAKFLCGISSPLFVKLNIRNLADFGSLAKYPFLEVKTRVGSEWSSLSRGRA